MPSPLHSFRPSLVSIEEVSARMSFSCAFNAASARSRSSRALKIVVVMFATGGVPPMGCAGRRRVYQNLLPVVQGACGRKPHKLDRGCRAFGARTLEGQF
eukprot:6186855-Pleurochrysis_carterae.AAC.1